MTAAIHDTADPGQRKHARGQRTRAIILDRAARIAIAEGLEGLSIGRLADDLGMSKSGLFAHFGSKEGLQIATVAFSRDRFKREVIDQVAGHVTAPGLRRLWALANAYLERVEQNAARGGCFLYNVSAEFDARPGAVRDAVAASLSAWLDALEANVRAAVVNGELAPGTDIRLLTFELSALLFAANRHSLLLDDNNAFDMARRAAAQLLRRVMTNEEPLELPSFPAD